jgi:hypothetical protein
MPEPHELGVGPYLPKPSNGHQLPLPSLDGTYHLGKHLAKISWSLSGQNQGKYFTSRFMFKRRAPKKKMWLQ